MGGLDLSDCDDVLPEFPSGEGLLLALFVMLQSKLQAL